MKNDILIYFDLITSLRTTGDVEDLVVEIDTFMQNQTLDSISIDTARKVKQIFTKNSLDINNKDAIVNFFTTLKDLLNKFKIIRLVLAFFPSYKTIEKIHNFVKENIGIGYILDIEILDEVLGGAIIIYNGEYHDYTLKKSIEETFSNKKTEILKLMQK